MKVYLVEVTLTCDNEREEKYIVNGVSVGAKNEGLFSFLNCVSKVPDSFSAMYRLLPLTVAKVFLTRIEEYKPTEGDKKWLSKISARLIEVEVEVKEY